nr:hypothetical protein [Tanacetum cinerariifolium]
MSPTIYTSCIKQFWTSAKVKTVNENVRLQALVDGQKVIVNEASIRRNLRLDDAKGTTCLPNAAIFEELARMRKHKSRRKQRKETKVSQDEPPTEEHIPTPSYDPLPSSEDRLQLNELMEICTKLSDGVLSLDQIKTNQAAKIKRLKKRVKKLKGKKKRTHGLKRLYKVGLSARIISSDKEELGDQEDASNQERIDKIDVNEHLSLINKTAQDQGRMNDQDMFGVNNLDVTTVDVEVSATLTITTATDDELTLAQTLIEIKVAKPKAFTTAATTVTAVSTMPKEKEIIIQEPTETPSPKPIVTSQQPSQPKDKGKAKMVKLERPLKRKEHIMMDEQIAKDLKAQMQADLEKEQRIAKQKEEEANIAMIIE